MKCEKVIEKACSLQENPQKLFSSGLVRVRGSLSVWFEMQTGRGFVTLYATSEF